MVISTKKLNKLRKLFVKNRCYQGGLLMCRGLYIKYFAKMCFFFYLEFFREQKKPLFPQNPTINTGLPELRKGKNMGLRKLVDMKISRYEN